MEWITRFKTFKFVNLQIQVLLNRSLSMCCCIYQLLKQTSLQASGCQGNSSCIPIALVRISR